MTKMQLIIRVLFRKITGEIRLGTIFWSVENKNKFKEVLIKWLNENL